MFEAFCKDKLAPLILRLGLGPLAIWHGFTRITANGGMAWHPGLWVGWQLLLSWGELAAGLAILLGLRCRLAALALVGIVLTVLIEWHRWAVFNLPARALEPVLLLVCAGLTLVCLGGGELSLDGRGSASRPAAPRASGKKRAA